MNLAKFILFACPLILTSVLMGSAQAAEAADSLQVQQAYSTQTASYLDFAVIHQGSSQPLLPTGCGCAQCVQAEDLIQGHLPSF